MGFLLPGRPGSSVVEFIKEYDPYELKKRRNNDDKNTAHPYKKQFKLLNNKFKSNYSILEKFPVEILNKIFIFSGNLNLLLTNKNINSSIHASFSNYKLFITENYLFEIGKIRYLLVDCLRFRFISYKLIQQLKIDKIVDQDELEKVVRIEYKKDESDEMINHLIKLFEIEVTAQEEEEEEEEQNKRLLNMPEQFYNPPFSKDRIKLVKKLNSFGLVFSSIDKLLVSLIKNSAEIQTIKKLVKYSTRSAPRMQSSKPLIEALKLKKFDISKYLILNNDAMVNDDELWDYVFETEDYTLVEYLHSFNGKPSTHVLKLLNI